MKASDSDLIGIREAARLAQCHENTVRRWIGLGILCPVPGPRGKLVRRADVEAIEERRKADLKQCTGCGKRSVSVGSSCECGSMLRLVTV